MIEARSLHYTYSGVESVPVLRGVSFRLEAGELVALMGANGSGKTTFVRCLNGLLKPTAGNVLVDGLSIDRLEHVTEIRRKIGLVFQNPDDQIVTATVDREIAFGLENLGVPSESIAEKVDLALGQFHLEPYRSHSPHLLSGGERQRLALASIWVMEPDYCVLDEPTSLLDPLGKKEIYGFIQERRKKQTVGFLLVTQFAEEALMCDRLVILVEGTVAFDGPPAIAFRDSAECAKMKIGVPPSIELDRFMEEFRFARPT